MFPTPDKARLPVQFQPVAEPRDARYPFALTTGRLRDQWHGMSRTGTLGRLFGHVPEPAVQLPQDMARRLLKEGELVHVTSRRGSIVLPVQSSSEPGLGEAFIAMHWGSEFLGGLSSTGERLGGVNALTNSAYCPTSRQPELKHAAVKILKAELPWTLLAAAWLPGDAASKRAQLLQALMALFLRLLRALLQQCAAGAGAQRERGGVLFRAAAYEAAPDELLQRLEQLFGLGAPRPCATPTSARASAAASACAATARTCCWTACCWRATPARKPGSSRCCCRNSRRRPTAAAAAPRCQAAAGRGRARQAGVQLLRRGGRRHRGHLAQCNGAPEQRLASLQGALRCSTNCGSCVPELKRMVRSVLPLRQAA